MEKIQFESSVISENRGKLAIAQDYAFRTHDNAHAFARSYQPLARQEESEKKAVRGGENVRSI